eukprot:scaffold9918_cov123-Isochrysis_galbana.AAC.6
MSRRTRAQRCTLPEKSSECAHMMRLHMLPRLYYCRRHAAVPPYAIWHMAYCVLCVPGSLAPLVPGSPGALWRVSCVALRPGAGSGGRTRGAGGPKETSVRTGRARMRMRMAVYRRRPPPASPRSRLQGARALPLPLHLHFIYYSSAIRVACIM